jgi:hypothetical protein
MVSNSIIGLQHRKIFLMCPSPVKIDINNASQEPTLVFVCIGEHSFTNYQKYIWVALEQARLIEPILSIVVILNSEQPVHVYERLRQSNINPVIYDELLVKNGLLIHEFRRLFFVQGSMEPDGNNMFVQYTTERLLAVHAYMNMTRKWNVFHMENDNMLYVSLKDLLSHMRACDVHLGLPKAALHTAVTSFVYARNPYALEHFVRYTIEIFRLGRQNAIDFLNTTWINDMTIAGRYLDLYAATEDQSRLTGVFELPSQFTDNFCLSRVQAGNPIIFDACVLGQYFGGSYSMPDIPYWEPTRLIDPRGHELIWKKFGHQRRVPFIFGFQIVNIHVHSKQLERFSSNGTNQPTGYEFKRSTT